MLKKFLFAIAIIGFALALATGALGQKTHKSKVAKNVRSKRVNNARTVNPAATQTNLLPYLEQTPFINRKGNAPSPTVSNPNPNARQRNPNGTKSRPKYANQETSYRRKSVKSFNRGTLPIGGKKGRKKNWS